jgi:HEAT repeat protein
MKTAITKLGNISLLRLALLFSLAAAPLHALSPGTPPSSDHSAYAAGTRAMNDQRWQDAVASFDKVIDAKEGRADAALYWKAYSLNKLGNGPLALATCYQLRSQYSSSRWNNDCGAMSINIHVNPQINPQVDVHVDPHVQVTIPPIPPVPPIPAFDFDFNGLDFSPRGSEEDLKILALNSLLNQDPGRAIPLLRGILTNPNQPSRVKKHALFVLAQSKSPEAQSALHDAVVGKMDPELQREAIQSIAVFQGKRANDTLTEVYRSTTDQKVKESIISALFITQDAPRMVDLARNEKDLNLKRRIVSQLALMNDKAATDYMMELLK